MTFSGRRRRPFRSARLAGRGDRVRRQWQHDLRIRFEISRASPPLLGDTPYGTVDRQPVIPNAPFGVAVNTCNEVVYADTTAQASNGINGERRGHRDHSRSFAGKTYRCTSRSTLERSYVHRHRSESGRLEREGLASGLRLCDDRTDARGCQRDQLVDLKARLMRSGLRERDRNRGRARRTTDDHAIRFSERRDCAERVRFRLSPSHADVHRLRVRVSQRDQRTISRSKP